MKDATGLSLIMLAIYRECSVWNILFFLPCITRCRQESLIVAINTTTCVASVALRMDEKSSVAALRHDHLLIG
jgi:hypothetical protein